MHHSLRGLVSAEHYWLGFSLIPEIGTKRIQLLLDWFGDLEHAWAASETQLRQCGLDRQSIANILSLRPKIDLLAELTKVERLGAHILTLADEAYPELLRKIADPPAVLYVKGELCAEDTRALSIVGTRRATQYGRDVAHQFAKQLAKHGVTIISGLAHGVDSASHLGALEGGGRTIAVLGCGIDRVYPNDNQKLAAQIREHGALVTEFPIGMPPEARNFPRRNRIISGLSLGVMIVEAPEKSGAVLTASVAAEQGREVFAVPGNIFNPTSVGTNRLIQDGAKLVLTVEDILDEFEIVHQDNQIRRTTERIAPMSADETLLLEYLTADPIHIDDLVRLCGLAVSNVTTALTLLELKGLARTVGYMQYCLKPDFAD
jgi:DNA processing protein